MHKHSSLHLIIRLLAILQILELNLLAKLLINTTRKVIAPAICAAAKDIYSNNAERIFISNTQDLISFFIILRELLRKCSIYSFIFNNLYKPTHSCLIKIFLYIINFIYFCESQTKKL
ncbi:hypothetical protein HBI67_246810 [Parastagonospora nodorum]|nr:hypothetical protein HBI67_246810 [Parastagonospora nodorum]KAH6050974.1 hypothetical protein HBI66_245640 [Parastagonospora nodorum]